VSGEEISQTLSLLFTRGDVMELRALRRSGGMASGYYTDKEKLVQDAGVLDNTTDIAGIYVILNKINPDLLARRANRIDMRLSRDDKATGDEDIIRRHWLPIDIDPKRPSGISSSETEHEKSLWKARKIRDFLTEMGWPEPILADSGNGAHLLYRIDLPNDQESNTLIKNSLTVLSTFFSDAESDIDRAVSNAARIWKLYGTLSRKGDSTTDRPHRRSKLLRVPKTLEIVESGQLSALRSLLPSPEKIIAESKPGRNSTALDLGTWLRDHGLSFREKPYSGGRIFLLDACPFSSAHKDGAYVIQFDNGGIFAGCHHNSCGGGKQRWTELREQFEGPRPKRDYEARIKQGIRDRAKARVKRDGYQYGLEENLTEEIPNKPDKTSENPDDTPGKLATAYPPDILQEAWEILKTGDPLAYSLETFARDHEGDQIVAECLALSLASRSIKNPKSKGLHVSVTGVSGKGKSDAFDVMLLQVPNSSRLGQRLSDKALFYAENLRPGMVITLDDTGLSDQMQEILKGVTSSFQKPFQYLTVNTDRKAKTCTIPERCLWWIAKVEGTGDDQVLNRMLTTWIDDSAEQDKKVLHRTLDAATALPGTETILRTELKVCQAMWDIIFSPVWVVIPYAQQIKFNSISNRRNPDMLIDLIRAHAIMNQYQRKREEINKIICITATMEDFVRASALYSKITGKTGGQTTKLTRREADVITAIRNLEQYEFTIAQVQRVTGLSYNAIYKILHGTSCRGVSYSGLLEKCPALSYIDRTVTDEREGLNVKRRTKAYLWDDLLYETWSGNDECWISDVQSRNDSDDDSRDGNGGEDSGLHQLLHHCNSGSNKSEDNSAGLKENNQNNTNTKIYCNNTGIPSAPDCAPENETPSATEVDNFASQEKEAREKEQNPIKPQDMQDLSLQPLQQHAARVATTNPVSYTCEDIIPISSGGMNGTCALCNGHNITHRLKNTDILLCTACKTQVIQREAESIRTLPGVINISGMKRTNVDHGRCSVCNLQGISFWDQETKTGLCSTCYERETLLARGESGCHL